MSMAAMTCIEIRKMLGILSKDPSYNSAVPTLDGGGVEARVRTNPLPNGLFPQNCPDGDGDRREFGTLSVTAVKLVPIKSLFIYVRLVEN